MEANASSAAFLGEETEANITLRSQLESPLLRLPAELRNHIYTYVGLSTVIEAVQSSSSDIAGRPSLTCSFQLPQELEACKQIRQEATSLICRSALFDFSQCHTDAWLKSSCDHEIGEFVTSIKIGGLVARYISQHLRDGRDPEGLQFPTKWLPNVERIYIESVAWRQLWEVTVRESLKVWCKKDTLQVIFV